MKKKTDKITSATEVKRSKAGDKYKKCCHFDKKYNKKSTLIIIEDGIRRECVCSICGELIDWWEIEHD